MIDFKDFVENENKKTKKEKENFNPKNKISFFVEKVNELYSLIDNDWLRVYLENNEIKTSYRDIQIREELLGLYTIREKIIEIGKHIFILRPIGTILIGTPGRVDLLYQSKQIMFILVGKNTKNVRTQIKVRIGDEVEKNEKVKEHDCLVWKYTQRGGMMTYHDLSAESFQKILMILINGEN